MIAEVLTHYGADLSRVREHGWRSLRCPFHDDRTASGSVNLEKDAFVCHGCGVKGDAIKIIMDREGMAFADACNWAADVLGASGQVLSRSAHEPRAARRSRWRTRLFDGSHAE